MSSDDIVLPIPNLKLPQQYFLLSTPTLSQFHEGARTELLEGIKKDRMLPYSQSL
jgi:26S proteasome regulatory subunit N7